MRVFLLMVLGCFACGSDSGTSVDATPDSPITASNHLGELCNTTNDTCPNGTTCRVFSTVGDDINGFCAPDCTSDTTCEMGYPTPNVGTPVCFTDYCVVTCTSNEDCPTGLECFAPGGPAMVCAQPER